VSEPITVHATCISGLISYQLRYRLRNEVKFSEAPPAVEGLTDDQVRELSKWTEKELASLPDHEDSALDDLETNGHLAAVYRNDADADRPACDGSTSARVVFDEHVIQPGRPGSFFQGHMQLSSRPMQEIDQSAGFGFDDRFHHQLSRAIQNRSCNGLVVVQFDSHG